MTRQTVNIAVTTESESERVADVAILTLERQGVHITEHIQHRKP